MAGPRRDELAGQAEIKDRISALKDEEMTDRDWRIFRENNDIIVKGTDVPNPIKSWESVAGSVSAKVLENIHDQGFKEPTPIQMQAISTGVHMRDLLGLAPTGSGKSCAFLLPIISFLLKMPPVAGQIAEDGPYSLIMAPTRELAQQIELEFQKLTKGTRLRSLVVVGGKSVQEQGAQISRGVEIVIGTPGRIEDMLEQRLLVLNQCFFCVLDEADKMIEMDLEESVTAIISQIPESLMKSDDEREARSQEEDMMKGEGLVRNFMMFSATMQPEILALTKKYLKHHVYVQIGDLGSAKKEITQKIEFIPGGEPQKRKVLAKLLDRYRKPPIIIFVNQKAATDDL